MNRSSLRINTVILSGITTLLLAGCASPQSDPSYVSPTEYQDYNCKQIHAEMHRLSGKIDSLTKNGAGDATGQTLNAAVTALAIMRGYSFSSDNNDDELTRLKAHYDALDELQVKKDCVQ